MEQRIGASLQTARFNTLLLTILGGLGVVLAVVGIYGVIAYFVTRRTREIGVRMALGATRRDVIALVVRQAVWPVGLGVAAGVIASLMATRLLRNQLFERQAERSNHVRVVAVAVTLVALLASFIPALRAAGADPTSGAQKSIGVSPQLPNCKLQDSPSDRVDSALELGLTSPHRDHRLGDIAPSSPWLQCDAARASASIRAPTPSC